MSLKDKIKGTLQKIEEGSTLPDPENIQEDVEVVEEYLASHLIEASMHYAMGSYVTFCRLKGLEPVESNVLLAEMGKIPEGLDTPESRSEYFLSIPSSVGAFLDWYLGLSQ